MDKVDLLKRADELLAFIIEGLQQGKELAEREAPLVVREVIQWGIVEHAILAGVGLLGLLFGSWLFLWSRQQYYLEQKKSTSYGAGEGYQITMFFSAIGIGVTLLITVINAVIMAKAIVAPRLYLLGELKQLLK